MFYRVSNAVIAPKLVQDLGLNAETLGIIGEAFFCCFALLQIPMGPMLANISTFQKVPIWKTYQNLKVDKDYPGFYIDMKKSRYRVCITNS